MSERDFYTQTTIAYPIDLEEKLSDTSDAKTVFTGYKFSGKLQRFLLDYSMKVMSNIPLSDEVKSNANRPY